VVPEILRYILLIISPTRNIPCRTRTISNKHCISILCNCVLYQRKIMFFPQNYNRMLHGFGTRTLEETGFSYYFVVTFHEMQTIFSYTVILAFSLFVYRLRWSGARSSHPSSTYRRLYWKTTMCPR